ACRHLLRLGDHTMRTARPYRRPLHLSIVGGVALLFGTAVGPAGEPKPLEEPKTKLGVKGTGFTLNDKPTFLYGISYYAGLGASEEAICKDLVDAKKYGF